MYGEVAGRIIEIFYVRWPFVLTGPNLTDLGTLSKLTIMEETPLVVGLSY